MIKKIALLGDFNPGYSTHHAINDSIRIVKRLLTEDMQFDWVSTDIFDFNKAFAIYSGLWIAPGSPYKNMENVINAIEYTRKNNIPTFGNCGGFQHMIIEYAKNVCGIVNADHEETNPRAKNPVISRLVCSLLGESEELEITDSDSFIYRAMKKNKFHGKYFCSYGINDKYKDILRSNGLSFIVKSADGQIRAFELKSHPFFVGTLFQPALNSCEDNPDPLIEGFVQQVLRVKDE
jgi:CTP synthase (UTP-ammonia lyase)